MKPLRFVQIGLGPIGLEIIRHARRRGMVLVGAVDIDPRKIGQDVNTLLDLPEPSGVRVVGHIDEVEAEADLAIHAATSWLEDAVPDFHRAMKRGWNLVSTCEELTYPYHRHPRIAEELHQVATNQGVRILGTGINPGFLMDTLILALSTPMLELQGIRARRHLNPLTRRLPFQRKVGIGQEPEAFRAALERGEVGHVGLPESAALVVAALGLPLSGLEETREVVLKGQEVQGVLQRVVGFVEERPFIELEFRAATDVTHPVDEIHLIGHPELRFQIPGGVPGDAGTVATTLNVIPSLLRMPPGLYTMDALPLPHFWAIM